MADSQKRQWIMLGVLGVLIIITGYVMFGDKLGGNGNGGVDAVDDTATALQQDVVTQLRAFDTTVFDRPDFILLDRDTVSPYAEHILGIATRNEEPVAPSNIRVTDLRVGGALLITWTEPDIDPSFDHIAIYRSETLGDIGDKIADVSREASIAMRESYVDRASENHALENDTLYYYTVRSVNTEGVESHDVTQFAGIATDQTPPANPTGITVTNTGKNTLKLTWTKPVDDTIAFDIYRSLAPDSIGELHVADIDPALGVYEDTEVTPEVAYYYTFIAKDAAGNTSTSLLYSSKGRNNPFESFAIE